jgi:hypothetical protein
MKAWRLQERYAAVQRLATPLIPRARRLAPPRLAMHFDILGEVSEIETIAVGSRIRDRDRLLKLYGKGNWRKMKGVALIRLRSGRVRKAEIHWYEAHGVGKKEFKRKRYLD